MRKTLLSLLIINLFSVANAEPKQLTIYPAKADSEVKQYKLLPQVADPNGMAGEFYAKAAMIVGRKPLNKQVTKWCTSPQSEFPIVQAQKVVSEYSELFLLVEQGARCGKRGEIVEYLPEYRDIARLLSLKCHL